MYSPIKKDRYAFRIGDGPYIVSPSASCLSSSTREMVVFMRFILGIVARRFDRSGR